MFVKNTQLTSPNSNHKSPVGCSNEVGCPPEAFPGRVQAVPCGPAEETGLFAEASGRL